MQTITKEESDKLLSKLLSYNGKDIVTTSEYRNHLMALLMLDAGLRCGEVVQLLQTDLYIGDEPVTSLCVRAEIAKRKHERIIPLTHRVREAINLMHWNVWTHAYPQPGQYAFFVTLSVHHLSRRQLQRIIKSASLQSIGRAIHPHALRHTFASRLMRTCNARIVQELLGHKYLTTTQIYTHPNHQDFTDAIKGLE